MDWLKFVIYKQDDIWGLESTDHDTIIRSQHSSRMRALNSLFKRYPNLTSFRIIVPAPVNTNPQDYTFEIIKNKETRKKLWLVDSRKYISRAKALSGFFARHPRITLFYIVIPIKKDTVRSKE